MEPSSGLDLMEIPTGRRKVPTYGKAARKILIHDLFDVATFQRQDRDDFPPKISASHVTPSDLNARPTAITEAAPQHPPRRRVPTEEDTVGTKTSIPAKLKGDSQIDVPTASLFELHSSDDEPATNTSAYKRRKVIPLRPPLASKTATASVPRTQKNKSREQRRLTPSTDEEIVSEAVSQSRGLAPVPQREKARKDKLKAPGPVAPAKTLQPGNWTLPCSPTQCQSRESSVPAPEDRSKESERSRRSTPKRRRVVVSDEQRTVSSLSERQITSLRLTPERSLDQRVLALELADGTDSSSPGHTPKRSRQRLVDRLDPPRSHTSTTAARTRSHPSRESSVPRHVDDVATTSATPETSGETSSRVRPSMDRSSSSQSTTGPGKSRLTYAKQRSHLSDMVDSLESLDASGSFDSSQDIPVRLESFTSLASHMELDDEVSDDQGTGSQLKSIHELRQAGAVNRYDRELDAILEDIGAPSASLQVQALMQLIQKLDDQSFKRHVQNSGKVGRLIECATMRLDAVSAVLMLVVLRECNTSEMSDKASSLLLTSLLPLSAQSLNETRSLSEMAKDRRQHLPRALVRDLVEFESYLSGVVNQGKGHGHDHDDPRLSIPRLAIESLEHAMRIALEHKEPLPELPGSTWERVAAFLRDETNRLVAGQKRHPSVHGIATSLSLLEMSSAGHKYTDSDIHDHNLAQLSETLAAILRWAREGPALIEQSALRLLVSFSNNKADICRAFASGRVGHAVFAVVDDNFLPLAERASQKQPLDGEKLDATILALGCLLNFADCDDEARRTMIRPGEDGRSSQVERLVHIFNRHIDQTSEVCVPDVVMENHPLTRSGSHVGPEPSAGRFWLPVHVAVHSLPRSLRLRTDQTHRHRERSDQTL